MHHHPMRKVLGFCGIRISLMLWIIPSSDGMSKLGLLITLPIGLDDGGTPPVLLLTDPLVEFGGNEPLGNV